MSPRAGDRVYAERLGEVLRTRDAHALRAFLVQQAARYGDARQVEVIEAKSESEMHTLLLQMIVARPDLADLHATSKRCLADRAGQ